MELVKAIHHTFNQLQIALSQMSEADFNAKPALLNGASVGQHYRHLLEMFICLNEGYEKGIINYDNRKRDTVLEQNKHAASECLITLLRDIDKTEKTVFLQASYSEKTADIEEYASSYYRELAYTFEHTIHHMALIRIGLNLVAPDLKLPENFGVAVSTVKHKSVCVQ